MSFDECIDRCSSLNSGSPPPPSDNGEENVVRAMDMRAGVQEGGRGPREWCGRPNAESTSRCVNAGEPRREGSPYHIWVFAAYLRALTTLQFMSVGGLPSTSSPSFTASYNVKNNKQR